MQRYLQLGIIQMPLSASTEDNVTYLEERVKELAGSDRRPELVVGVEFGVAPAQPESPAGPVMQKLAGIAARYQVYLIPGSLKLDDGKGGFYNVAPVFGPRGNLIGTYAKMVPWDTTLEKGTVPGREYLVFDLPEKDTRVGVQICFDADFPEISRAQTLLGAEVLVQLSMDPDTIPLNYNAVKTARAIENQVYYVYTNGVGDYGGMHLRGHSRVIDPEGNTIYEAGEIPTHPVITLDLARVRRCRREGSWQQVAILEAFFRHRPGQPFAGRELESPLFKKYFSRLSTG